MWRLRAKSLRWHYRAADVSHCYAYNRRAGCRSQVLLQIPYQRSLEGGSDWTYFEPERPIDRLTATAKNAALYEREGSLGRMLFVVTEITYRNQFNESVVQQCDTGIYY